MRCALVLSIVLMGSAGSALAGTATFNAPFTAAMAFQGNNYDGSVTVKLPQFDDMKKTLRLDSVTLTVTGFADASATAENNEAVAGTFGVGYPILFTGTGPGNNTSVGVFTAANSRIADLAASDGMPGGGPDYVDFGTFSDPKPDSEDIPTAGALNSFIGTGQFSVLVKGSGNINLFGTLTDVTLTTGALNLKGNVQVKYSFTALPEPSSITLAMLGLVGIGAVANRAGRPRGNPRGSAHPAR